MGSHQSRQGQIQSFQRNQAEVAADRTLHGGGSHRGRRPGSDRMPRLRGGSALGADVLIGELSYVVGLVRDGSVELDSLVFDIVVRF